MAIKVVLIFQITTDQGPFPGLAGTVQPSDAPSIGYGARPHQGGWTESLIWDANTLQPLINAIKTGYGGKPALGPARAALLPAYAAIVGARFYQGGAGKGQSLAFNFPGNALLNTDVPQMSLLMKAAPTSVAVARRSTIRCIPDSQVSTGEFSPSTSYAAAVLNYFDALGNFSFYAVDPTTGQTGIFSIDATGLVTCLTSPQPFLVGQLVTIQKTINAAGQFVTFTDTVKTTGPLPSQFTINNWTAGVCAKGKAVIKSKSLFQINSANCAISRVVVRKIGRPSELYRGRRSKRKRVA